ncbi:MAG: alpha/beta fold hydrolase [Spirochaetia bacterium]
MKWLPLLPFLAMAAAGWAAPAGVTADMLKSWDVFVAGTLAGNETVTVNPDGISSTGGFTYQNIRISTTYTITFDGAGRLASYKATITAAGRQADVSAAASGQTVSVKVSQAGNLLAQKDLPLTSATVLLDNNIASQYRLLSRVLDPSASAKLALQLLVPSAAASVAVNASVQPGTWKWKWGASEGTAVRWEISSAALPPLSIYQDSMSREILSVDIPSGKVTYTLTGLTLASDAAAAQKPASLDMKTVAEKEMTVKTGSFSMGATLTYPKTGSGPFPGVLLVAGSGPNDRDETIGPNKPFRDIAAALANRGFAVLRFDKRTYAYHGTPDLLFLPTMTVKEEFIDDAISAFRVLASEKNVDGSRLSLIGHSLGAWGLPFIIDGLGADAVRIKHLVFLAPAGRDWGAMLLRQLRFQLSLSPDSEAAKAAVAEAEKRIAEYRSAGSFSSAFMGASALYWNDLFGRDPIASAEKITTDMLFVRGSKDIQVDASDVQSWQAVLGGRPNVAFVTLANLNHLFIQIEGQSTGAEYFREGHVSQALLDLLATRLSR